MDEKREREKRGKVGDNNRLLVGGEERVRGSPEHVTIIPSREGGCTYTRAGSEQGGWCARQSGTRDRLTQHGPSIVMRNDKAVY